MGVPLIALLISLFSSASLPYFDASARAEYIIRHYTTQDGLPLNSVIGIVQAADGFIYLATLDGLVRYDGYEFEVFTTDLFPELGSNRVQNIGIDENGLIWLGSTYGIVSSFDGNHFRSFNPDNPHPFSLQQRILPQFRALGTDRGIILHERREPTRTRFVPQLNSEIVISANQVRIDGKLVLETPDIVGGFADQEGTIWIYTYNTGLYHIRRSPVRNITNADNLPVQNIYSIIELPNGDILAGSLINGTVHFRDSGVKLSQVGNVSDHLNQGRFLYYDEVESRIYKSFFRPNLWMYEAGSWIQQPWFHDYFPETDSRVDAMHRAANGKLYIGSPAGMLVKEQDAESVQSIEDLTGYNFRFVRVIRELEDGTLFFGTNGSGLYRLNPDLSWQRYTTANGLHSNFIRDIYVEDDTTLWLATEDHGLSRLLFDDEQAIISTLAINRQNGLISNALHRIIPDPYGYLWINSNSGIMRLSLAQLESFLEGSIPSVSPLILDERNGLVNREGNGGVGNAGLMLRNGLIAFPNQAGIVLINPSDFVRGDDGFLNPPFIKRIQTNSETLRSGPESAFDLKKGERDFRVHFTLPNFENPQTLNFSYQLIGFDRQPQFTGNGRTAFYTNVPPGEYLFRVTATGFDGQFAEASIPVIIPPYFYETTLFYFFSGIGLLMLLGLLYKQRVKALQARQEQLSALVEERTRDLHQATSEIRKAAVARSRLFSGISHDLKTPLSLIEGPLDEVSNHPAVRQDPQLSTFINLIKDNSSRLHNLVNQILEVTKLNADVLKLQFRPADLVQLTHNELSRLSDLARNKAVEIRLTSASPTLPLHMDHGLWERVITNLVRNALRFSPENSEIRVHLEPKKDLIFCTISDQGPGIAPGELPHIFEYLYQGKNGQHSEGTGIGLYLVKGLIERAGGSIRAYNHEKGGAVFEIRLRHGTAHLRESDLAEPLHSGNETAIQRDARPSLSELQQGSGIEFIFPPHLTSGRQPEPENAKPVSDSRPRLLVTEDNRDFRTFLVSILEQHYETTEASNGHEALRLMQEAKPDLIISDVMMPGMDGITLVKEIRSRPGFETLPVLFISAKDQLEDVAVGLSSGADVYLTKPVNPDVIRKQVHAMLRRERLIRQITPGLTAENPVRQNAAPSVDAPAGKSRHSAQADEDSVFGQKVREIIFRHLGNSNLNTQLIADSLFLSRSQLYRKWEKVEDLPLNKYITKVRIEEACQLMTKEGCAIAEAANAVGYQHASYFSTLFRKETGMSPSEWLQRNTDRPEPFAREPL